ncbi:MAG: hypothetical protein AAFY88_10555 [Acidobacteriota bacterium]
MDHDVHIAELRAMFPSSKDFSDTPFRPMANHRFANFAASGDAKSGVLDTFAGVTGMKMEAHQGPMFLAAMAIAAKIVPAAPQTRMPV